MCVVDFVYYSGSVGLRARHSAWYEGGMSLISRPTRKDDNVFLFNVWDRSKLFRSLFTDMKLVDSSCQMYPLPNVQCADNIGLDDINLGHWTPSRHRCQVMTGDDSYMHSFPIYWTDRITYIL